METEYKIECPICDIETSLVVLYSEEPPAHCPMCGSDADPKYQTEED